MVVSDASYFVLRPIGQSDVDRVVSDRNLIDILVRCEKVPRGNTYATARGLLPCLDFDCGKVLV